MTKTSHTAIYISDTDMINVGHRTTDSLAGYEQNLISDTDRNIQNLMSDIV